LTGNELENRNCYKYVTPLREGGSLPAIIEADDDGMYVLKFHGAGQGPKALIAELVAGNSLAPQGCRCLKSSLLNSTPNSRAPSLTRRYNT